MNFFSKKSLNSKKQFALFLFTDPLVFAFVICVTGFVLFLGWML